MLSVPDEIELRLVIQQAEAIGIRCASFFEPDDDMGFTAACTEPVASHFRRFFRRYSLWNLANASDCSRGPPAHH